MTPNRDGGTGRFIEEFPLQTFIDAVRTLDTPTTTNVAEAVGCSYDLAYRRLKDLEAAGEVESTEIGSAFLWSTVD